MKHASHRSDARHAEPMRWMPAAPAAGLDLSHWQSRAARGHTWNGRASTRRPRTH
jgi:hypothetical protein